MDLLVYDDRDQRYVPLAVALGAVLLTVLLVGGLALYTGRPPTAEPIGGVSPPQAGGQQQPTCTAAFQEADEALALAARLDVALQEQTAVMDEMLAGRLTEAQALDRALPPLTAAAKDRQALLDAVTTYRQAREACPQ